MCLFYIDLTFVVDASLSSIFEEVLNYDLKGNFQNRNLYLIEVVEYYHIYLKLCGRNTKFTQLNLVEGRTC